MAIGNAFHFSAERGLLHVFQFFKKYSHLLTHICQGERQKIRPAVILVAEISIPYS